MTNINYNKLLNRFREVFKNKWGSSDLCNYDDLVEKFAFHMTDIADDIIELADTYKRSDQELSRQDNNLTEYVERFIYHSVPHIMAAAQIYDEVLMIFDEQKGVHDWDGFVDESES